MAGSLGIDGLTPLSKKQLPELYRVTNYRSDYFVKHVRLGKTISLELLFHRKIKVTRSGIRRKRFVFQCEMPPFFRVVFKSVLFHNLF